MGTLWEDQGLVFPSTTGRPPGRDAVYLRSFVPLLKRTSLPSITLHDLQQTCATLLFGQGMNPKYVQKLLGHASGAMTLDRYSQWVPSMGEQTARAWRPRSAEHYRRRVASRGPQARNPGPEPCIAEPRIIYPRNGGFSAQARRGDSATP